MSLSLAEHQTVNQLAKALYDFLPGKPHPYADKDLSFPGIARSLGLSQFWVEGTKLPSLTKLLVSTLELRRGLFCDLILAIVRNGMIYRSKNNPITREEIRVINDLIAKIKFKIPDLWDPAFLDSLPSANKAEQKPVPKLDTKELKAELVELINLFPQQRGFAFEKFLNELFAFYNLAPRSSFRIVGEQIDGSFEIEGDTYLVEAKWHDKQIGQDELLIFNGKVGGKSTWSRGLFVSYSGFSQDGLTAFSRGKATNIIGMNAQDLFFILEGEMTLVEAIRRKARRAAETGEFFVSIFELSKMG